MTADRLLRVYDPAECDPSGAPLDWERCRTCDGIGRVQVPDAMDGWMAPCTTCDGHGSIKRAVLLSTLTPTGIVGRVRLGDTVYVQASWRQVDLRTLGWEHDLRPEKLAVLCLRCYANKTNNKENS